MVRSAPAAQGPFAGPGQLELQAGSRRALDSMLIALVDALGALALLAAIAPPSPDGLVCVAILVVQNGLNGTYRRPRIALSVLDEIKSTLVSLAAPIVAVAGAVVVGVTEEALLVYALLLLPGVVASRTVSFVVLRALRRRGHLRRSVIVVGSDETTRRLVREFGRDPSLGLDVAGYVDDFGPHPDLAATWLGPVSELDHRLTDLGATRLIVGFLWTRDRELVAGLRGLRTRPLEVLVLPRLHEFGAASGDLRTQHCSGIPLVWLPHREWRWEQLAAKRLFDVMTAAVLLCLLAPALLVVSVAVRLSSRGPVLFRQQRVGKDGRVFEMLKFRSMRHDPSAPVVQGGGGSPRVTAVGRLIRLTSLDELPQLVNVLKGDMSMVGPRPEIVEFVDECQLSVPGYSNRHRVHVGLTGWAQINKLRGVGTSLEDRARYDNFYIEHWSIWRDAVIILRTASVLMRGS